MATEPWWSATLAAITDVSDLNALIRWFETRPEISNLRYDSISSLLALPGMELDLLVIGSEVGRPESEVNCSLVVREESVVVCLWFYYKLKVLKLKWW